MATLLKNSTPTGTLPRAYASVAAVAANATRKYWSVINLSPTAILYLSLGSDSGNGVGCHPILPGKGLGSSAFPELNQTTLFLHGATDGHTFTFEEVADSASAITVTA